MYRRATFILKKKFPAGHPNIDIIKENYDELKQKMAEQSK